LLTPAQSEVLRLLGDYAPLTPLSSSAWSTARPRMPAKGRELEGAVREIEEAMYAGLDVIGTDAELATVIAVLERMVAGHPSGDAIAARVARDG
jgi:hypothetical protein